MDEKKRTETQSKLNKEKLKLITLENRIRRLEKELDLGLSSYTKKKGKPQKTIGKPEKTEEKPQKELKSAWDF